MTLDEIKQRMADRSISVGYMADCCGVSKIYLQQVLGSPKRLNKTILKKIEGVFKTLEITPNNPLPFEQPVVKQKRKYVRHKQKNNTQTNNLRDIVIQLGIGFGPSTQLLEFDYMNYHFRWKLEVEDNE